MIRRLVLESHLLKQFGGQRHSPLAGVSTERQDFNRTVESDSYISRTAATLAPKNDSSEEELSRAGLFASRACLELPPAAYSSCTNVDKGVLSRSQPLHLMQIRQELRSRPPNGVFADFNLVLCAARALHRVFLKPNRDATSASPPNFCNSFSNHLEGALTTLRIRYPRDLVTSIDVARDIFPSIE